MNFHGSWDHGLSGGKKKNVTDDMTQDTNCDKNVQVKSSARRRGKSGFLKIWWDLFTVSALFLCVPTSRSSWIVNWTRFCHTMLNEGLIYCSVLCSHCGYEDTLFIYFFWWSDWRTGSALGLIECHAVSSWLCDWVCCSLLLVNNIPGAKYVNVMIIHILPDHFLRHTFLATAV